MNPLEKIKFEVRETINLSMAAMKKRCFGKMQCVDTQCIYSAFCQERFWLFCESAEFELSQKTVDEEIARELMILAEPIETKDSGHIVDDTLVIASTVNEVPTTETSHEIPAVQHEAKPVKEFGYPKSRFGFDWDKAVERFITQKPTSFKYAALIIRGMLPGKQRTSAYNYTNTILSIMANSGTILWNKGDKVIFWQE